MKGRAFVVLPGETDTGEPIFSVVVKRTYAIQAGKRAEVAPQQRPLVEQDEYFDSRQPHESSIRYETDLWPHKLATDVVVVGAAYAPQGRPVSTMTASVAVGKTRKKIWIVGDRCARFQEGAQPVFTEPLEFTSMEIRYERAYGGVDRQSFPDMPIFYPRNHVGCGYIVKNTAASVEGVRLPNVEDPEDLLTPARIITGEPDCWNRQPLPQGFGWFHGSWYPRCSFMGAMPPYVDVDEVMREEALGLVPQGQAALAAAFRLPSRDARFFNGASLGLALPYLRSDEHIELENLTPEGSLHFVLPGEAPAIALDIGSGENALTPVLHTVVIRPEDREIDMVWRGSQPYPGIDWLPEMKCLRARVQ